MFSIVESIVFYTLYMMQEGKCSSGNRLSTLMFVYRTEYSTLNSSAVYNIAFVHFVFVYSYVHFSLQSSVQFCINYAVHCTVERTIK